MLEVAFLAALAALAAVARLRPDAVVGVMVFGWVVVALAEWSSWLDRPHFGRGLPPRFYVPQVSLPPPRPREQRAVRLSSGDPRVGDEPTFVASVTEWAAELGEWPVMGTSPVEEETQIAAPDDRLDYGFEFDDEPAELEPEPGFPPEQLPPEPEFPPDIAPPALPVTIRELEPEPLVEEAPAVAVPEPVQELPEPAPEPAKPRLAPVARTASMTVHHVDPLTSSARRRLFRRSVEEAVVAVPDGPPPDRMLPGRAARARAGTE